MTKQKLIELAEKVNTFMCRELNDEKIVNVATAMIFTLAFQATQADEKDVLPETICMRALMTLHEIGDKKK